MLLTKILNEINLCSMIKNNFKRYLIFIITMIFIFNYKLSYAGKNIIIAVNSNFTTFDPYDANDTLSQAVAKSFYQGLFSFDKNMKLHNVLAENYNIECNGTIYNIKLRQGIKFQDGTEFNAEAVKINFDRASNFNNHLKRFDLFKMIKKIEIINTFQVQIILKKTFSSFINSLAHPSAVMISPTALKKYGKKISFHPVGTGPFCLQSWNGIDTLKIIRFNNYWKKKENKLDSITWRIIIDNNTRAVVLNNGEVDLAYPISYEQINFVKRNNRLRVIISPSIIQRYISFNVTKKPFDNIKIRKAINYAINKDALIKVIFSGYAIPAKGLIPLGIEFAVQYETWPYNLKQAILLLQEAGYPNGFSATLWSYDNSSTSLKMLQFIQQQLHQIGIKLNILAMDISQRIVKLENVCIKENNVQMFYGCWSASTYEANWAITPLLASQSMPPVLFNTAFYSNNQVDNYLNAALETIDHNKKMKIYKNIQDIVWKEVPWVILVTDNIIYAHDKNLKNFFVMPDGSFEFSHATIN